jgi:hypothetical protein
MSFKTDMFEAAAKWLRGGGYDVGRVTGIDTEVETWTEGSYGNEYAAYELGIEIWFVNSEGLSTWYTFRGSLEQFLDVLETAENTL